MISKQFDEITRADIDALMATGVPEGHMIEYKPAILGNVEERDT